MEISKIKTKIRAILKKRKMTIYQLAMEADISESCIRNWYSKRNYQPSLESLIRICSVLDISLSQLFINDNEKFYPIDSELKQFIDNWLSLDADNRKHISAIIDAINKEYPTNDK